MKLPDLEAYLKLPGDYPIAKVTFEIHRVDKVAEGFVGGGGEPLKKLKLREPI